MNFFLDNWLSIGMVALDVILWTLGLSGAERPVFLWLAAALTVLLVIFLMWKRRTVVEKKREEEMRRIAREVLESAESKTRMGRTAREEMEGDISALESELGRDISALESSISTNDKRIKVMSGAISDWREEEGKGRLPFPFEKSDGND